MPFNVILPANHQVVRAHWVERRKKVWLITGSCSVWPNYLQLPRPPKKCHKGGDIALPVLFTVIAVKHVTCQETFIFISFYFYPTLIFFHCISKHK